MENARVAIIEDMEKIRGIARAYLTSDGHSVVAEAATLDEALELVDQMEKGEIEADVVLLDGNLGSKLEDEDYILFDDARQILGRIRQAGIAAAVIGFSSNYLIEEGIDVDADAAKDMDEVISIIESL